jgi:hypothetical protein
MLRVNAEGYLIEAGNVRHEHEFKVWRDVKLPAGTILIRGVVSHSTDLVEHPELVADRIITFAEIVDREYVIAGTDCGLGGRVHPQIAWAKLRALRDGATFFPVAFFILRLRAAPSCTRSCLHPTLRPRIRFLGEQSRHPARRESRGKSQIDW